MGKEKKKRDVITIDGMIKLFNVSRGTIYNKYKPRLKQILTSDNRVYFDYEEAVKLHKEFTKNIENFNVIA